MQIICEGEICCIDISKEGNKLISEFLSCIKIYRTYKKMEIVLTVNTIILSLKVTEVKKCMKA